MGCFFIRFLGFLPFFREYKKCVCVDDILLNFMVPFSFTDFLMMYRNIKINVPTQREITLRDSLQKFITLHKARSLISLRLVQNACRN